MDCPELVHETPAEKAFKALGGAPGIKRRFKISLQAAHKWRVRIPASHAREVGNITGVSQHETRPDIFGAAPETIAEAA